VKVWCYGELEADRAMASLAGHRNRHEERVAAYRAIRAGFEGVDPRDLPAAAVCPYLTLEGGIAMAEAFLAWCRNAEEVLALRTSARVARQAAWRRTTGSARRRGTTFSVYRRARTPRYAATHGGTELLALQQAWQRKARAGSSNGHASSMADIG
jgi:hypothetical protein